LDKVVAFNFQLVPTDLGGRISCQVASPFFNSELFFEISCSASQLTIDQPDWAAIALIYPAMLAGVNLEIEAPVSPRLLFVINGDLQSLLRAFDQRLKLIEVTAQPAPSKVRPSERGVGTGFSAGVDSFATFISYTGDGIPEETHLTHLMVHNVGSFGHTQVSESSFLSTSKRAAAVATEHNLETIFVNSNLSELFESTTPPSTRFEHTHSLRNVAAAHACHGVIGQYVYSSAHNYESIGIPVIRRAEKQNNMGKIDPILLPLLSTERLWVASGCAGIDRVQKTSLVAESPLAQDILDVCLKPPGKRDDNLNCSQCGKCIRTLATLEAIGRLDDFAQVFDFFYLG